jgi:hypothetical protein
MAVSVWRQSNDLSLGRGLTKEEIVVAKALQRDLAALREQKEADRMLLLCQLSKISK